MDERQWVQAIQKGDKRYFQDIAEKYYDDIFRFCAFQTSSREDAYDMAQETFLRFIRYVEGYHDRNLKGYLLTIAMNVCRDYLRRKGREDAVTVRWGEDWQWEDAAARASGRARCRQRDGTDAAGGAERSRRDEADAEGGAEWSRRDGADAEGGAERSPRDGADTEGGAEWSRRDGADAAGGATLAGRNGSDIPGRAEREKGYAPEAWVGGSGAEGNRAANPERHAVERDVHQRLMQALAQLPDRQREAILLHYLYDMKYREIGRLTDASVSTVKSRVRQGMEKLQSILQREDFLD